ncbi:MAG: restriction endonuclease subunit S, partial [Treponema sp.]|nr:restriction endonuclease subunit S [Treponema sp.]
AFIAEGKYWVNNHAHVIDCFDKSMLNYLCHFINAIDLDEYITGSAQPKFTQKALNELLIPLPPLGEQKRIVSKIENAFFIIQGIEENKSELTSAIKQAKSKILDFAIHGKLVPQDSNDEPAEELLKRIATSDNRPYEKFEFVDDNSILPNGWVATQMGTYIDFTGGAQPPKETFEYTKTENNIRLIQIRDYKTDEYATYIPKNLARRTCSKTDIMIGRYGPPLFQILRGIEGAYNVALMKAESKVLCNDYLFYMLQDEKLLHFLESLSDRTCGQDGVNMYELKRYPILVPPLAEQQRIVSKIEEIFSYLDTISSNLE